MWMMLLVWGCQEPFGERRQDLRGFRIAALTAPFAEAGLMTVPEVSVVHEGRLWSDEPVSLQWHWVEPDPEAVWGLSPDLGYVATGAGTPLVRPNLEAWLALVAIAPDGEVARAFLDLPRTASEAVALEGVTWSGLDWNLSRVNGEDLREEVRAEADVHDATSTTPRGFLRFNAPLASGSSDVTVRWMSTRGTWLELDPMTADWTPGHLVLDGDDVEEASPGEPGSVSVLALATDGAGHNDVLARDLWVGDPPQGMYARGRWLGGEAHDGWILARLDPDDTSPSGLTLSHITPIDPPSPTEPNSYGTDGMACAQGEAFDPNWLLQQRCTRSEVVGTTVALFVSTDP